MLITDYTAELLNLKDVITTSVANILNQLLIGIALPRREYICPYCGDVPDCMHDHRIQIAGIWKRLGKRAKQTTQAESHIFQQVSKAANETN